MKILDPQDSLVSMNKQCKSMCRPSVQHELKIPKFTDKV